MSLFSLKDGKLEKLGKINFQLELEIQKVTEDNLKEVFGLEFVSTEFQLNDLRIDSLGFDKEKKSFVVIEYKRGVNFSVIDQGYAYLAMLLNNKAEFILEYNEKMDENLRKDDVDWSQSKVIFVAPQFTKYQKRSIEFKDLAFELWEISKYSNDTVLFNQLKSPDTNESIKKVSTKSKVVQQVNKEVFVANEEDHFKGANEDLKELYYILKSKVMELDSNIEIKPFIVTIAFKLDQQIINVAFQKSQLKIWINLPIGELNDPKELAKDVSNVGHWGIGDYEINLKPGDDLNYLMTLIEQSYKKNS